MTNLYDREPEPSSYPPAPKKKKLPYIIFAIAFVAYFIVIVTTPLTFDWWSLLLWLAFMGGIAAIVGGARPPGWRKDAQGRNL